MDIIGPILALIVGGLFALWVTVFVIYHSSRLIAFLATRYIPAFILNPISRFIIGFLKVIGNTLAYSLAIVLTLGFLGVMIVVMCLTIPFICFPIIFI